MFLLLGAHFEVVYIFSEALHVDNSSIKELVVDYSMQGIEDHIHELTFNLLFLSLGSPRWTKLFNYRAHNSSNNS
jgi:hypothetical protein